MRKNITPAAMLAATILMAAPALAAQDTPQSEPPAASQPPAGGASTSQVKAGDTVYDPSGASVGTIQAIEGDVAVLSTGSATIGIPASAISQGASGPTIALTKAEVEAEAAKAQPQ